MPPVGHNTQQTNATPEEVMSRTILSFGYSTIALALLLALASPATAHEQGY
jgi:hypothetical protein